VFAPRGASKLPLGIGFDGTPALTELKHLQDSGLVRVLGFDGPDSRIPLMPPLHRSSDAQIVETEYC